MGRSWTRPTVLLRLFRELGGTLKTGGRVGSGVRFGLLAV